MASTIQNFTSGGRALPFRQRPVFPNNGGDPAPIRSRLSQSGGISGSRVRVTNPAYGGAGLTARRRTASLGMGGVGQRGRSLDPT
jgi:hypothetical protein